MTDRQVVAMALAAFVGALNPSSTLPFWLVLTLVVMAYSTRKAVLLILCVAILCSTLAARSWSGIETVHAGAVESQATMVSDPVRRGGGTTAIIRIGDARLLASGWGASGAQLGRSEVGDHLLVEGTYRPYGGSNERKAALHVGTRFTLNSVSSTAPPNPLFRLANLIRSRISEGASSLNDERRALFTGLVYGDDRGQAALVEADFRLAGLTHLLAVSGQNVAYVLTLSGPAIRRLSLRARWVATIAVLLVFATVTRFEPSVLRATMMAGLAVTGDSLGREVTGGRLLALAVTLLLVIDPLLATTVAFRLSVAASSGIAWIRPVLLAKIDGPNWRSIREIFSVTLAAQLAVAPVLVTTFGPVSLISLPANVLAGPIAGIVMTWGMTAGMLAGFAPPWVGAVVHLPTNGLLQLLEAIARSAARVPLAPVGLVWIAVAVGTIVVWPNGRGFRASRIAIWALWLTLAVALIPAVDDGRHLVGPNSEVWASQGRSVLILRDTQATVWLLDDLRASQIRVVDFVFVDDPGRFGPQIDELDQRLALGEIRVVGDEPLPIQVGSTSLVIRTIDDRLVLTRD